MTEEKERLTRGSVIKGYARYIKRKWGQDGVAACQKALGLENFKVSGDKWYPESINTGILHWIADNYGREYVEKAAESTVTERGVIAFAARVAGIENVLARGVEDYYRNFNFGEIKIVKSDGRADIYLIDSPIDELDCLSWQGAFKGILKICKKNGSVREVECVYKGGKACKFEMIWKN